MSATQCVQSDVVSTKHETEMKEEQKHVDEHDIDEQEVLIANAMSGDKIKELLSSSGPTVKAVLLKSDGTAKEIEYDSTPSTNHVTQILGAPPSIIGQYADLDVIVVGPRYELNQESPEKFARNQHKLRYPFNNDTFYGDIFLYRFDQNCVVQDFTLKEYNEFAAKSNEDIGKVFKPQINDQQDLQDDEEEFDDEEEDFDEEAEAQYVEDFMREIIVNKVKSEFPQRFGREPTEEELESYVAGTMQAAGALFGGAAFDEDKDDIQEAADKEEEEEDDEEYDPTEDKKQAVQDEIEDIPNDEELDCDKKDIENVEKESKSPLTDLNEEDEEKLVNSEEFENELRSAIECVQNLAKFDKHKILLMAREQYKKDTGHEPSDKMMDDAFKMFADDNEIKETFDDEQDGDIEDEDDVDPELFAKEMDEALANVRKLGAAHQEELVNKISGTFTELNGAEPSTEQIAAIFGRIKEKLADEARDDFLENNEIDDSDDGEYTPNEEDIQQVEEDKKIELLEELVQKRNNDMDDNDDVDDDKKKVKILVTPVKKRPSGSRMEIYLNDQPDTNKTLEFASSKFEQINGRAPTDDDKQRLKEFLTTGMLFESEMNPSLKVNGDNDNDNDNDDDDDEDYTPDKDTFDYSRDIEDDLVESEQDVDENDDTSNMVDID